MSDLISRSQLLKEIETWGGCVDALHDYIQNMPTAYDVDKVVEELKVIKEDDLAEYNIGEYNLDNNIGNSIAENYRKDMNEGKCFAYDEAIEIVKQGDVYDNVCEYKIKDKVIYASCNNKQIASAFCWFNECGDYKYCPYCGKKIKVVG